jgi:putative addiction module component (TIGR02574 family)
MIKMQEIFDLSVDERISIAEQIWDSIDPSAIQLSSAHEQELDRRLNRYEKGETTFFRWSDIKSELNPEK